MIFYFLRRLPRAYIEILLRRVVLLLIAAVSVSLFICARLQIGRMVKLLQRKGQLDRTWVVVTSDHGYHLGQFAMPIDKRLPYETDVRVPLVLAVTPSHIVKKNMEIDSLAVVSIDLAPTVLDMAGIPVPDDMDGVSLLPLIAASSHQVPINL